jgi:hypothetical protein
MSPTEVLQSFTIALLGVVSLAVVWQSVRSGRTKFRGTIYERASQPVAFRLVVLGYAFLGLLMLAGMGWILLLSERNHEPRPPIQKVDPIPAPAPGNPHPIPS